MKLNTVLLCGFAFVISPVAFGGSGVVMSVPSNSPIDVVESGSGLSKSFAIRDSGLIPEELALMDVAKRFLSVSYGDSTSEVLTFIDPLKDQISYWAPDLKKYVNVTKKEALAGISHAAEVRLEGKSPSGNLDLTLKNTVLNSDEIVLRDALKKTAVTQFGAKVLSWPMYVDYTSSKSKIFNPIAGKYIEISIPQ